MAELAVKHGVAPLLARNLSIVGVLDRLPPNVARELRQQVSYAAAFDAVVAVELRALLAALRASDLSVLLLKGAALAYSHYPASHLRLRSDTDLLIRRADRARAAVALRQRGYEQVPVVTGDATVHQQQFRRVLGGGVTHQVDVHWKLLNPVAFADVLSVEELIAERVPIPAMGAHAYAACPVHMLVHLAMHRIAHHEPDPELRWLYDVYLVAMRLTQEEWNGLRSLVESRGVAEVVAQCLVTVASLFPLDLPPHARAWVDAAAVRPLPAVFQPFAASGRRVGDVIAADIRASRGWRGSVRVVRDHVLPPADYMRARYGVRHGWLLPYYYAQRLMRGVPRLLRRVP